MKIVWITTRPWLAVAAALLLSGVDSHKNGIGNLREAMPREHLGKPGYLGSLATHVVTVSELLQGTGSGSGKPFFAYLGFQANHVPVRAPQSFIDKYKGRYKDGWTALRQARRDRAAELGLIPKGARMVTMSTTADSNSLSDKERRLAARQMEVYAAMAEAMDHQSAAWFPTSSKPANSAAPCSCSSRTTALNTPMASRARGGRVPRCRRYRPRSSGPAKLAA